MSAFFLEGKRRTHLSRYIQHFTSLLLALLLPTAVSGQSFEVDILLSDRHRPHVAAVKVLQQAIRADDIRLFAGVENGDVREEEAQMERIQARHPDLLVVVGEDALQAAVHMHARMPVVSIMSMRLNSNMQGHLNITGIDMRPSPAVVAGELAHLLPRDTKILSYYNPAYSAAYIDEALDAFRKEQLVLMAYPWPEDAIQHTLNKQMKSADAYWMQLEYQSVNSELLKLLFALAKHGKKLIGLSEKYVRAGALMAWSPQAEPIGHQAARLINRILDGEQAIKIPIQHSEQMKLSIRTADVEHE